MIDFRPYAAEPILGRWRSAPHGRWVVVLWTPTTLVLLLVLYNTLVNERQLQHRNPLTVFCQQIHVLNPQIRLPGSCLGGLEGVEFQTLHDLFSLAILLILALTLFTWAYQWSGYEVFATHMTSRRAIRFPNHASERKFEREIRRTNRYCERVGRSWMLSVSLSALSVLFLCWLQWRYGVFARLAPTAIEVQDWSSNAYVTWWANPANNVIGFVVYVAIGTLGLYIISIQNLVGMRILLALWRTRNDYDIGADHVNADGYFGWSPVRRILSATYCQIAIHGVVLVCLGTTLPPVGLLNPAFLLPALQWLITLPFYLIWPIALTSRKIAEYKELEVSQLQHEVEQLRGTISHSQQLEAESVYADRIAKVRAVARLPYGRPRDSTFFIVSLVADTTAVVSLLYLTFGGGSPG